MDQGMRLLVFPVKDLAKAEALYRELLGVDPYADAIVKDADGNVVGLMQSP